MRPRWPCGQRTEAGGGTPLTATIDNDLLARSAGQGNDAENPVLISKLTAPGRPGWAIARPRIDHLLEEGTRGPLTVVTGPPGAGKSMSIALWAVAHQDPAAWITLDEYDNRPQV